MSMPDRGTWKTSSVVVALVAVGALGIWVGRCSRTVREVAAEPSGAQSAWAPSSGSGAPSGGAASSGDSPEKDEPQNFDTKEIPEFKSGVPLRPMDRDIFAALANEHLDRKSMPDVFPDRPYKVRLAGSVEERRFAFVMIDMNRDGKVDERWQLKGSQVLRTVTADPNAGDTEVKYTLAHGRWQPR